MRRYQSPYYGKRFILDTKTGVAHDLKDELPECRIDEISAKYVFGSDQLFGGIKHFSKYKNDCEYCLKFKMPAE